MTGEVAPRIALASCSLWPAGSGDHAGLTEALGAHGAEAEWVVWDDGVDWGGYDLVLLRETWDYPPKLADFLRWVDRVARLTAVVNPPVVVRWNHHKGYLRELAEAGVPVVPTTVVPAGAADVDGVLRSAGAPAVVVKPAVAIGGDGAERGPAGDPAVAAHLRALLASGDALVQPYLVSVETTGETSLVVLGGQLSHAVSKVPAGGEFRVHQHRGGTYAEVAPSAAQVDVALAACQAARSATGEDLIYARADLVAGDDGRPLLMELELIEPSLYLHTVPLAADRFAALVATAARTAAGPVRRWSRAIRRIEVLEPWLTESGWHECYWDDVAASIVRRIGDDGTASRAREALVASLLETFPDSALQADGNLPPDSLDRRLDLIVAEVVEGRRPPPHKG